MQLPEKLEAAYYRNTSKTGYKRQSFDIRDSACKETRLPEFERFEMDL